MTEKVKAYQKEYHKKYYDINKEKLSDNYNKWKTLHPLYYNKAYLKLHNLTIEDYNNLFINQDGKCAICGIHQSEINRSLAVDHNHDTGEIR